FHVAALRRRRTVIGKHRPPPGRRCPDRRAEIGARRFARIAVRPFLHRVCKAREGEDGRQGRHPGVRREPARRRHRADAEGEAGHGGHGAAVDGHVLGRAGVRTVRDAVPGERPRSHEADRQGDRLADPRTDRGEGRLPDPRHLGKRLSADHEQPARDQGSSGSEGHQAARAEGEVAREDVPGLRREPIGDGALRGLRRPADGGDGRRGESSHPDLHLQVPGGAEVPLDDRPRVHARVRRHLAAQVRRAAGGAPQADPGGRSRDAGLRVPDRREDGRRAPRQAEAGGNAGEPGRQASLPEGQQVRLRRLLHRGPERQADDREGDRARIREVTATRAIWRRRVERILEWISGALLVVLAVEVLAGVIFRAAGRSLSWYDEVASVLLAWITYYGSALAALKRSHIAFPGLVNAMPRAGRFVALAIREIAVLGFFLVLAWQGTSILHVLAGETLVTVDIPVAFTQSVIPIGAALFVVAELLNLPDRVAWAEGGK